MNGMDEGHTPVELVKDQPYYVSGLGIYTYAGPVDTISQSLWPTIPKSARNAETPGHKFRADPNYSQASPKEVYVVDEQLKRGEKIHPVPSAKEAERALRLILTDPHYDSKSHYPHLLSVKGIDTLAAIIRDHKKMNDQTAKLATDAMSYVIAYHMQSIPSQAADYLDIVAKASRWNPDVPLWPVSRETMIRLVDARKKHESFTPELIAELSGRKFVPTVMVAPRTEQKPVVRPPEPVIKLSEPKWTPPIMVAPRVEQKADVAPPAAVIPPAPVAASLSAPPKSDVPVIPVPEKTPSDKGFVSANFKIAVRRHPDDLDTSANDRLLELNVIDEDQLPVALTAAKALTPMAFDIFSRISLRSQTPELVAERVGTDVGTVYKIFDLAADVVAEEFQGQVASLKAKAAEISHKNEPS